MALIYKLFGVSIKVRRQPLDGRCYSYVRDKFYPELEDGKTPDTRDTS